MNKLIELAPNERKIVALALAEVASNPGLSLDACVAVTRLAMLFDEAAVVLVRKSAPAPTSPNAGERSSSHVLSFRKDH